MKELIIATTNKHKVKEFSEMLVDYKVLSLDDIKFNDEIVEDGKTFEENALIKAETVCKKIGKPVIADDSGLEIFALNNEPGVFSARYLGHDTPYNEKNKIILSRLEKVADEDRGARFVCCIAVSLPNGKNQVYRGEFNGKIAHKIAGENGFGYDPIFFLPEYNKTAAEIDPEEKNRISHRGKALRKLLEALENGELCL